MSLIALAVAVFLVLPDVSAATPRVLVPWSGASYDHTTVIVTKWKDAVAVGGVLEFEAGRVYRTTQLNLWKRNLSTDGDKTTAAGIDGNGAMLKWLEGNVPTDGKPLLYVSEANFKGNSGFFIRNLTIDCGNNDIPAVALTLSGYMFGFQIFGSILRYGRNVTAVPGVIDADQTASGAGTAHTVVHTDYHAGMSASRRTFRLVGMAPDNGTATTEGSDPP